LYHAFGWKPPLFCHLPMVMGQDGKKLSKRHGATSVNEFRKAGYLADALINYVALLGASYKEGQDIYTLDELAAHFSLQKLNKAPAVFDYKKLEWFNAQYIKAKPPEELAALAVPFAVEAGLFGTGGAAAQPDAGQYELFVQAMTLVAERAVLLRDIPAKLGYLFAEPPVPLPEEFIPKKSTVAAARNLLGIGRALVPQMAGLADAAAEELAKGKAAEENVKIGDLLMPLRVAITGSRISPPLFASIRLLKAEKCLARVDRALAVLSETAAGV
jgi:glutamyl-tRNA synthetase